MGERSRVVWMAVFIIGVFVFVFNFAGFNLHLTGYAIFTDIGDGQTILILQEAGSDNLGDVYVEKATASRNHGDKDELKVQRSVWQRAYLRFNISLIPANQIIDNASLCLFLENDQGAQTIFINHVYDDSWCEGDGGVDASPACEITWDNQPCGMDEFVIGGDCNAIAEDSFVNDGSFDDSWHCFDVGEMMSNDYPDGEVSMVLWTVDSGSADIFASKENADMSLWPYLNITYHVDNEVPVVSIDLPQEGANYNYNESLVLNFSASDADGNLDSCWYNIDDGVNISLDFCANMSFDVAGNGNYILNVYVNDSFGEEASDSINFNIDIDGVFVVISEPVGEKNSRTGISIVYSELGAEDCWYNVETSIGGSVIGNTSLVDCGVSSFDVSVDGDYVLNLFANNSLGSFGFDNSGFSVDSSEGTVVVTTPGGGASSGSGGGSFDLFSPIVAKLEIEGISAIVSFGEEKSLVANVKNVGRVSANKCSLVAEGNYIDSVDLFNIGVGEIVEFAFILNVTEGISDLELSVECLDNVSAEVPLDVIVLASDLDVSIDGISFGDEGEMIIDYSIEPVDSSERILYFRIINSDGGIVKEVSREVSLVFGEVYSGDVSIDVSDVGEGILKVSVGNEEKVSYVEEDFIYGGSGMTGFVGLDIDGSVSLVGIMLLVFLVLAGLIIRRIWKLKRK